MEKNHTDSIGNLTEYMSNLANLNKITDVLNSIPEDDLPDNRINNGTDEQKANVRIADLYTRPLYLTIGVMGIISNLLVILVILKSKAMRQKLTNIFILHQSIVDTVVAFFLLVTTATSKQSYKLEGVLGEIICRIWLSSLPLWSSVLTSTYNLVVLSLERYLEICHPLWHKVSFTATKAALVIASIWMLGLIHQLPTHLSTAGVVSGKCYVLAFWTSAEAHSIFGVFNFLVRYLIPLVIMMTSYAAMVRALRRQTSVNADNQIATVQSHTSKHQERMRKARQNVFKTLFVVTIAFAFCWTLNQLLFIMFTFGFVLDFGSWWYNLSVVLVNFNCCINPFIYAAKYQAFQKSAKALFCSRGVQVAPLTQMPPIATHDNHLPSNTTTVKAVNVVHLGVHLLQE